MNEDQQVSKGIDLRELDLFSWKWIRKLFLFALCLAIPICWIEFGSVLMTIAIAPLIVIGAIIGYFWYLLPSFVSHRKNLSRKHNNLVVAINLLLGWCIIGWIIALIFAFHRTEK